MDLHESGPQPTPEERSLIDGLLGGPEPSPHQAGSNGDAPADRDRLLPLLHGIQDRFGWIPPGALNYLCRRLGVPPAEAYGVASFYGLFSVRPSPPRLLHVCDDIACLAQGAEELCRELEQELGAPGSAGTEAPSGWVRSPCLGQCEKGPAALIRRSGPQPQDLVVAPASLSALRGAGEQSPGQEDPRLPLQACLPQFGEPGLRLLQRVGRVDPCSLDDYRSQGGYQALRRAFELGPQGVIREVVDSRLSGRGGAAFPTGRKWQAVAAAAGTVPASLVCNADESEPGTFKDRVLMEGDPFGLIESMTLAAFATGCRHGFLYVRGEYPEATRRLELALQAVRTRGYLGSDILGRGFSFDIEIRRGAGAYICGEETALFNSIEGYRGEPRNKPPFPAESGLFGRPTLVNNVETLMNVPEIILRGGAAFAAVGSGHSTGTRLFCLSGDVVRPGVYEVPLGTSLGDLIERAGGAPPGRSLQAVLLGGAAGSFLSPSELELPLTLEAARAAGATLGSGAVILFDDSVDLRLILHRAAAFFRDESCGQCVPCRVGTVRQQELLQRLQRDRPIGSISQELRLLKEIGQVMRDASICGLGQTASSAVESALQRWPLFGEETAS